MTTEQDPQGDELEELEDDSPDLVKRLRQQLKDKDRELAAHRPLVKERALREAGFDPDSPDGKMLAELADLTKADLTKDGIAALAQRYGKTPTAPAPEGTPSGDTGPSGDPDPARAAEDQERAKRYANADATHDASASINHAGDREEILQRIDKAQETGDVLTVIALQRQLTDVPK